jgi:hypothetical protein
MPDGLRNLQEVILILLSFDGRLCFPLHSIGDWRRRQGKVAHGSVVIDLRHEAIIIVKRIRGRWGVRHVRVRVITPLLLRADAVLRYRRGQHTRFPSLFGLDSPHAWGRGAGKICVDLP